jgi:hypothetical protein
MKEGDPDWEETVDSLEVVSPVGGKDARFQLLTTGLQLPACSFVSRSIDDVWFLDTGVDFDGGRMYIGEKDFVGLASVAGYVSKASASRVYEENERLNRDLTIARNLIRDLRAAVAGLVGAAPVEGSENARARKRTDSDEPLSLGTEANPSDLDLDAL